MVNTMEYITSNYDTFVNADVYCSGVTTDNFGSRVGKKVQTAIICWTSNSSHRNIADSIILIKVQDKRNKKYSEQLRIS